MKIASYFYNPFPYFSPLNIISLHISLSPASLHSPFLLYFPLLPYSIPHNVLVVLRPSTDSYPTSNYYILCLHLSSLPSPILSVESPSVPSIFCLALSYRFLFILMLHELFTACADQFPSLPISPPSFYHYLIYISIFSISFDSFSQLLFRFSPSSPFPRPFL